MIAGDGRGGRRQILSMAGVAAADADEVIALLFQEGEGWIRPRRRSTVPAATPRGAAATPSDFRSFSGTPSRRATSLSPRLAASIAAVSPSPFACNVGALCEKHLHDAGRHGVRSGGVQQGRIAADILDVDFGAAIEQQS